MADLTRGRLKIAEIFEIRKKSATKFTAKSAFQSEFDFNNRIQHNQIDWSMDGQWRWEWMTLKSYKNFLI